jgi:transketolase
MRGHFIQTLMRLAEQDARITLLTGDLGFGVVESFAERFPRRYINVGVAEQDMVGIATGLAEAGQLPFTYSIAPFATLRPYEFIRNGPVLHSLPVRFVGVGGGFEYGTAGWTHHALEDLAVMRVLPGLTVIAPADHAQASAALDRTWDLPGPIYYRLGKDDVRTLEGLNGQFELGRVESIQEGTDVAIVTTGAIAFEALAAARLLGDGGISSRVMILATISPSPVEQLAALLRGFSVVATVEAHYVVGGLGSLVSEVVAGFGLGTRVLRFGVERLYDGISGSESYMNRAHGLTGDLLAGRLHAALRMSEGVI